MVDRSPLPSKRYVNVAPDPLPVIEVAGRNAAVALASLVNVPLLIPLTWLGCEEVTKGAAYS